MNLPNPLTSSIALFQYLFLLAILVLGIRQYVLTRQGIYVNKYFVIPLGVLCLILGFVGLFVHIKQAFALIDAAGDISPRIVAQGIKDAYDYPILGLIGLALSYAFKFINSNMLLPHSNPDKEI
jgi:hypothetical protein